MYMLVRADLCVAMRMHVNIVLADEIQRKVAVRY